MKIAQLSAIPLFALLAACSGQTEPRTIATGASCASLQGSEDTLAHLYAPGTVYDAEPIKERIFRARADQPERIMGASLAVRAEPGMSSPYMQRVLACHAAQGSAAHPNDPLHPTGGAIADLTVRESQFGFRIDVRADSPSKGDEIWKRAEALSNQQGSVQVDQVAEAKATLGL